MKRLVSVFLSIIMIFGLFSSLSVSADENNKADNCKWFYNDRTNQLTVFGKGRMNDYDSFVDLAPWSKYSKKITSIEIGAGITYIGKYAFSEFTSLKKVNISYTVSEIGDAAFANSDKLSNFIVSDNSKYFSTLNGNLYDKNKKKLVQYAVGKKDKSFVVPKSVKKLGAYSFSSCKYLTTITLPNKLISIDDAVFSNCSNLTKITIPKSVSYIGFCSFMNCKKLKAIVIPIKVNNLFSSVFYGCTSLSKVIINKGKTNIGEYAFGDCINLTTVNIPSGIIYINDGAFRGCKKLNSVVIPMTVKYVGVNAFSECNNLKSVTYYGDNKKWRKIKFESGNNKLLKSHIKFVQPVTSVKLNKKSVTLKVKGNAKQKTVTLTATVSPSNAYVKTVTWKSSNSKVATVNSKGKVTAKKRGTCYIIATAKDGSKKYAKCKIVVK